jgi:hypothetical protein
VPFAIAPGKARRITDRMFSDRFHRLNWQELEGSEVEAIAFPADCNSRYPDLRAYVDATGRDGSVDAVFVARQDREGRPGLFVERQRLPVARLLPQE